MFAILFVHFTGIIVNFLRKFLPGLGAIARFIDDLAYSIAVEPYVLTNRERSAGGEFEVSDAPVGFLPVPTPTSELLKFWAYGHFACDCPECQAAYVQDCADADARVASWQEEEDYCNANGDTIGAAWANEHKRDTSLTLNDMTPEYDLMSEWAGKQLSYDKCGMDESEFDDMIRDMSLEEEANAKHCVSGDMTHIDLNQEMADEPEELASNFATECSTGQYTAECDECGSSFQSNVYPSEFALCNKCMCGEVDGALIAKIAGERQPDEHPTRATSDVGDVLMFCEACGADVYVTQAKHELWQEGGLRIACKEYD